MSGYVYAIQVTPGRVKLGYTTNVESRRYAIEGHAGEAVVLRSEAGTREQERRLHYACRDQHEAREHFHNGGAVAEYVAGTFSVADLGPVPPEVRPIDTTPGKLRDDISAREAARRLGVDRSTISRWLRAGHIAGWRTSGGRWRIPATEVARLLNQKT